MFRDHVSFISDEEYRQTEAFSYSLGKAIDESGPLALVEREDKKSKALEFGTLVDILLTNPNNKDNVFYTKAVEKPTASLLQLADSVINECIIEDKDKATQDMIEDHIKKLGLWSNIKDQAKLLEKWDNVLFWEYVESSLNAKGKIVTTPEILEAAENAVSILLNHQYTSSYFQEQENVEIIYQPCIFYNFKKTYCKAKIDMLRVDHNAKLIKIIDIKTGSELPSNFENSFYFFKYYLQVVSYILAIQSICQKVQEYNDYRVEEFKFIYSSKKMPNTPVVYTVPHVLLDKFYDGFDGYKGFGELLDEYIWYKENNIYDVEKKIYEKNGELSIALI